jgi:lysophospholipase
MNAAGRATDFVWGIAGRDPLTMHFEEQMVTTDRTRFQRTQDILKKHPALRLAGPTWGWVGAADRSIARLASKKFAEQISTPVLICGAGRDRIVVTGEAQRFAAQMPKSTYLEIVASEHEILMERDMFRAQFWAAFDQFMRRYV